MGAFALLFIGAVLPLAWEIALRPNNGADPTMSQAIVTGLLMTGVVGGGTGVLMSTRERAMVEEPGKRLPLLGWSMSGGDLRVPHFLGIHAMQALPVIAASALALSVGRAMSLFALGAVAYGLLTAGLLHRALRGKPKTKQ